MVVNFNKLWKKASTATNEADAVRTLAQILSSKEGRTFVLGLERLEAELCIEILDLGLAEHKLQATEKQAFFATLRRLSGKHARLPDSMVITDEIETSTSGQPHLSGGFADIKQGRYKGHAVAVKTLRVVSTDDFGKIRNQFCKEVVLWNSLSHPNVLKLIGVLGGIDQYWFAMVSEWMGHGNIMEYIKKHASNRLELLHGAARGLEYLHGTNLTHGDLKGANILITNDMPPKACLADFGFTTMVLDPQNPIDSPSTGIEGGTLTFMAPELLAPSKFGLKSSAPTQEGDIYAFGLVILQVLTGVQPFRHIRPHEFAFHVTLGARPEKPADAEVVGISNSLWELIRKCWDGDKGRRPGIQEVVAGVGDAAASWGTEMPPNSIEHREDSVEDASEELNHVGVFQSYETYVGSVAGLSPGTLQLRNRHAASTRPSEVETREEHPEFTFPHLDENNPPPPVARPPLRRTRFQRFLNTVFGCT